MYPRPHSSPSPYPSPSLSKFAFTHSEVRAKPQFKFQKHSAAMVNNMNSMNNMNIANKGMTVGGSKPRAAVFDGIRIIQDLRIVTGMCGACK